MNWFCLFWSIVECLMNGYIILYHILKGGHSDVALVSFHTGALAVAVAAIVHLISLLK